MASLLETSEEQINLQTQEIGEPLPESMTTFYLASSIKIDLNVVEFRKLLPEDINSHYDDDDCSRFLVARNLDLKKALDMITKRHNWYLSPFKGYKVANDSLCPKDLLHTRLDEKEELFCAIVPQSHLGEDKNGHPLFWEKSGFIASRFSEIKANFTEDEFVLRHIQLQEFLQHRCREASRKHKRKIGKQIIIMDLKSIPFLLSNSLLRSLKRIIDIDQDYYPETLKNILVINAPIYFTAIWAIVKPWLDPIVANKVQVSGSNFLSKLLNYMDIDQIPIEYGGKREKFSWKSPEYSEIPLPYNM